MKNKASFWIICSAAIALLAAAGLVIYFFFIHDGNSSDIAYKAGHKVYLSDNNAAYYTVMESRLTDSFKDANGNIHTADSGSKYLIVTVGFDFTGTDYSAADIAAGSNCFKDTEDHRFDEKLTNALNTTKDGASIKDAVQKSGSISAVDIVKDGFISEYMEIGLVNKHGIGETEKFIIE